jgi:hypothetical protein
MAVERAEFQLDVARLPAVQPVVKVQSGFDSVGQCVCVCVCVYVCARACVCVCVCVLRTTHVRCASSLVHPACTMRFGLRLANALHVLTSSMQERREFDLNTTKTRPQQHEIG